MKSSELIGQLLAQRGLITVAQLERALMEQEQTGGLIGTILINMGFIREDDFYSVLSEQTGAQYVKLKNQKIPAKTIELIPAKFATHYNLIPIDHDGNAITVAMANPLDIHIIDDLKLLLKKDVRAVLASETDILGAIKTYYGVGADTIEKITPGAGEGGIINIQTQAAENILSEAEDASIIKFVNQIFLDAYRDRATDIHIEPFEDELSIRYRIDGILYETKVPPNIKNFQSAIITRIKIMSNLNIAERRLPQDGRIKIRIEDTEIDLRVSILPSAFGESVVIRILSSNVLIGLPNLGLAGRDQAIFERLIKQPHGIIFVTGPTGSGKTTTLYAALSQINNPEFKIITIEDPIEYQMKGIIQVNVNSKIGLTFAQGLRSMLRHDPDIMMVGEVRDFETAEITIRVALTGHLVFSTIHTNDAAGGVTRLIDMGVEPFLVASSVNAFIAQRLVRVICPKCKIAVEPDMTVLKELGIPPSEAAGIKLFKGKGCDLCMNTGYKGRTAIYEILVINDAIRELILKRTSSEQIKTKALSAGMHTLRMDGWEKVKLGITTPDEILKVTQIDQMME